MASCSCSDINTWLLEQYPDKYITIVHSGSRLLARMPESASRYAENYFDTKPRVKVMLGHRIIDNERMVL
jgi:NADH dehydrogenase FAD-containing subunit